MKLKIVVSHSPATQKIENVMQEFWKKRRKFKKKEGLT